MTRPGRNEPCPCGSGKKYKRCCLESDAVNRTVSAVTGQPAIPQLAPDMPTALTQIESLVGRLPKSQRKEFESMLGPVRLAAEYESHRAAIDAASEALEAHRADYETLTRDRAALMREMDTLFDEGDFEPLRFTADDVHRAFEARGYPAEAMPHKERELCIENAALFLAPPDVRHDLTARLMLLLPRYVEAGRHMDAWIVQHCAVLTKEEPNALNGFLWAMFLHGLRDWEARRDVEHAGFMRDMGVDLDALKGMEPGEIDQWVAAQAADPSKKAAMERLMKRGSAIHDTAVANLRALEEAAIKLLEREDAEELLLPSDDLAPWLPRVVERLSACLADAAEHGRRKDDGATRKAVGDAIYGVIDEMAPAIFTPERVAELRTQLRDYGRTLKAAGDGAAARIAHDAAILLHPEVMPIDSLFLRAICFTSIRLEIEYVASQSVEDGG